MNEFKPQVGQRLKYTTNGALCEIVEIEMDRVKYKVLQGMVGSSNAGMSDWSFEMSATRIWAPTTNKQSNWELLLGQEKP